MKNRKLTIFDAGIAFILAFVISQATSVAGVLIIKWVMSLMGKTSAQVLNFCNTPIGYLIQAVFLDIGFVIVFLIYRKRLGKEEVFNRPVKENTGFMLISIVLGIATLFLLSGTLNYFQLLVEKMGFESGQLPYNTDSPAKYVISLISLAVLPAICEELLFRGVIINGLKRKGNTFAIVMSSVMFSIFHFSPTQMIYPVCFGIILAIVYLKTKNILFPILLHFVNNALTLTIQFVNYGEQATAFVHSIPNLIYALVTLAIWIVLICCYIKSYAKAEQATSVEQDQVEEFSKRNDTVWFWCLFAVIVVIYFCLIFV